MKVNKSSTESDSPKGYMNGRPKLVKKDTRSFIKRQINQIIPQLFSIRPTLNTTSPGLLSRKNYTTKFRPASTAESGQERETISMRNFYE
jgi:hypothetical protein